MIKSNMKKNKLFKIIISSLKNEGVKKIGVFGSYAKGNASPKSDLDLLVAFSKKKSLLDIVRIERELFEKLNIKIDLCTRKSISPYLIDQIEKEELLLYES
jgi:predicted nucleotidyltransferase